MRPRLSSTRSIKILGGNPKYSFENYPHIGQDEVVVYRKYEPPKRNEPFSGCFIPGTLVWTDQGEVTIQSLRENNRVLTRATSGEYGLKSDEVVALPVQSGVAALWGFNDEPVFFTKNHVFHTTTGLRAIDPESTKMENTWLEVGNLRRGHTLLRTTDGETYQQVTI
jgi:hypothetical protein